jgi:hypothetical protein
MFDKKTKAQIRAELEQQVQDFLRSGGEVKEIPQGQTGVPHGGLIRPVFNDGKPRESRTSCEGVLQTIDARRLIKERPKLARKLSKPKRKVIYDDFGEPIREVWE